jgi:hypothetical protein
MFFWCGNTITIREKDFASSSHDFLITINVRRGSMKKVLLAVVASVFLLSGCAGVIWNASFYETALPKDADASMQAVGAKEVAKYTVIFGYAMGYETYQGLVAAELRKGKRLYHEVQKNYLIYQQNIGYVQVLE